MPPVHAYRLFGVTFESEFEFPEFESVSLKGSPGRDRVSFHGKEFDSPDRTQRWLLSEGLLYWPSSNHRYAFVRNLLCGDFRVDFVRKRIDWKAPPKAYPDFSRMLAASRILGLLLPRFKPSLLLHAGIPVVRGRAVCFIGPSGQGKSTLTAAFLQAGFPVLSDEMAVIQKGEAGSLSVPPGLPDIRLWPKAFHGVRLPFLQGRPIMSHLAKRRFSLAGNGNGSRLLVKKPVPLGAVYVLSRRKGGRTEMQPLEGTEALLALFRNAYNRIVEAPEILRRQFEVANEVVRTVPVKRLSYPSDFSQLPRVREAILRDLSS